MPTAKMRKYVIAIKARVIGLRGPIASQTQRRSQRPKDASVKLIVLGQGNTTLYENRQEDQAGVYRVTPVPTKYYQVGEGSIKYKTIECMSQERRQ